jgi:hypothetical protein
MNNADIKRLDQASAYTGLAPATLRWRRARDLPPISRKYLGRVVYLQADLDAFVAAELAGDVRGANN